MKKVTKKYVYEMEKLESFHGMLPLDIYLTLVVFNYSKEKEHILLSLGELSHFVTECLVEFSTREDINVDNIEFGAQDIYISSIPFLYEKSSSTRKILCFNYKNKLISISESPFFNSTGVCGDYKKMKNCSKDELLQLILTIHQWVLRAMDDVVDKCNKSKKLSLVGIEEDSKVLTKDHSDDESLNDFQQIG